MMSFQNIKIIKTNIMINNEKNELQHLLKMQKIVQKNILCFKEALIYLDISKSFLYKLTHRKAINFTKPNNGKLYFKREDLDNWMLQNMSESSSVLENRVNNYLNKKKDGK